MRLLSQLSISFGGLLMAALLAGAFAIWSTGQLGFSLARVGFSHESFQAHLSLSAHLNELWARSLARWSPDDGVDTQDRLRATATYDAHHLRLSLAIRQEIARLRDLIGREIALVGEEEIDELSQLETLDLEIEAVLDIVKSPQALMTPAEPTGHATVSARTREIQNRIEGVVLPLIRAAIDGEADEVRRMSLAADQRMQWLRRLALGLMVLASIGAVFALRRLRAAIINPVAALVDGATRVASGPGARPLMLQGPPELQAVASAFNEMAAQVSAREASLTQANQQLEQRVAERTEDLQRLLQALQDANHNRQRMLADVSHELRTPLTVIRGEAEIALRGPEKCAADYRDALERCRSAAVHTSRLVDDLLTAARSEAGSLKLTPSRFNLCDLVAAVIDDVRTVFGDQAQVSFEPQCSDISVLADESRIRQVLTVLLDNAARYGGDRIHVAVQAGFSEAVLIVQDNGAGMDESELASAFDRFYRGSNAAGRYDGGAGLGLPVARAIVLAHGGRIALARREDRSGLRAEVRLPAADGSALDRRGSHDQRSAG